MTLGKGPEYLFIGGTWNMEWHALPGSSRYRVLVPVPDDHLKNFVSLADAPAVNFRPKVDYYHVEKFGIGHPDSEFRVTAIVFVLDGSQVAAHDNHALSLEISIRLMERVGYVPGGPHRGV